MTNKTGQIVRIVIASLAAAAFTVLLVLGINLAAIILRDRLQHGGRH